MARWKYPTKTVTVGDNTQDVRCLTAGERATILADQKEAQKGDAKAMFVLQQKIVQCGAVNPTLSQEEVETMPPDLLDACAAEIMALTGAGEPSEKKDESTEQQPAS